MTKIEYNSSLIFYVLWIVKLKLLPFIFLKKRGIRFLHIFRIFKLYNPDNDAKKWSSFYVFFLIFLLQTANYFIISLKKRRIKWFVCHNLFIYLRNWTENVNFTLFFTRYSLDFKTTTMRAILNKKPVFDTRLNYCLNFQIEAFIHSS